MTSITIQSEGRRHYLLGTPYAAKDRIRAAGCKWDSDRKAWWTGKRDVAEQLVAGLSAGDAPSQPSSDATVAARATYKGKTYYVAGRVDRGRTHWDDRVDAVVSRDGERILLCFRDGSSQFWAARSEVQIVKSYRKPTTIARLREYAEEARQARAQGHEDGIPDGRRYECEECGEWVTRGDGSSCWETGCAH